MDIRKRVILQRQLIEQVHQAAEKRGWVPKGKLSIYTVEDLSQMLAQIETGTKPRVFKDVRRRGPKPGWQERRPVTSRQIIKLYELSNLTGKPLPAPLDVIKTWTYAQAQAAIQNMWDYYWDMEEEREGFDVGSTAK